MRLGARGQMRLLLFMEALQAMLRNAGVEAETRAKGADTALRKQRSQSYQVWRERTNSCKAMATCAKGMTPFETQGWEHQGQVITEPQQLLSSLREAWEGE
eukprot:2086061-Amphidinium_carterae.1